MLQLEHAEQILIDLDQHALLHPGRLNRCHRSSLARVLHTSSGCARKLEISTAEPEDRSTAEKRASLASQIALWYDPSVAFARWDPIRDLLAIHQRLDRFAPGQAGWTPPVDLFETADAYIVTAELPGLSPDDLQIDFRDGRLTLSGVRREAGSACEQYHRMERGHGSFSRTFELPSPLTATRSPPISPTACCVSPARRPRRAIPRRIQVS